MVQNIFQSRYILKYLVLRDLKERYQFSVLGFLWTILHPLSLMVMYGVVFKFLFRVQIENYTVYLLSGIVPWIFLTNGITQATHSIINHHHMISKIYFPREIFPISALSSHFIHFVMSLGVFFLFVLFLGVPISGYILCLPLVVLTQFIFMLGISFFLCSWMVFFRDTAMIVSVVFQFLFFLCPIVYETNLVPEKVRFFYSLNPMVPMLEAYRKIFMYGQNPLSEVFLYVVGVSFLMMYLGILFFRKVEWVFPERA